MSPDQQDWQDELREQIQGARHMAEVSPDLVRRALIHMDAAVREVGRLQAAHAADLARLRALEEAHEHLTRELALAHAEADAATERVQHLLTTIDVERTGRKEAEDEVARLRGAIDQLLAAGRDTRGGQAVTGPATEFGCKCEWCSAYTALIDAALHAQDTEVGR